MTGKLRNIVLLAIMIVAGLSALASSAHAQGLAYGSWYSLYPADFTTLYRTGRIPTPPYFALHPPVYYSVPVPRTYGYSPYAYPPYVMTPEVEGAPAPKVIPNKYVPKQELPKSAPNHVTQKPLRIVNPYVTGAARDAAPAANRAAAGPQVVFPVAAFQGL